MWKTRTETTIVSKYYKDYYCDYCNKLIDSVPWKNNPDKATDGFEPESPKMYNPLIVFNHTTYEIGPIYLCDECKESKDQDIKNMLKCLGFKEYKETREVNNGEIDN